MGYYDTYVAGLKVASPAGPCLVRVLRKLADQLEASGREVLGYRVNLDVERPPAYGTWLLDVLLYLLQQVDSAQLVATQDLDDLRWHGVERLLEALHQGTGKPLTKHYAAAAHGIVSEMWTRRINEAHQKIAATVAQAEPEQAPPPQQLLDDTPTGEWGPEEWAGYLVTGEVLPKPELVEHLLAGYRRVVEAEEWLERCVENGDSAEIARAQRSLSKRQAEFGWTQTKVQAVSLGLAKGSGTPWKWPCKGARKSKLVAEVRAALDELRASLKARPEPEEPPLNEHGDRVFTPKGGVTLYGSDDDPSEEDWH